MTDDQLDELISCYLDGELSQQETQELESRLQSDPEAARRLRIMKEARKALLQTQTYRLPDNFAQRVLVAAQAEAERLGLPANHPIRLAEQENLSSTVAPATTLASAPNIATAHEQKSSGSSRWNWAYAAAAAALLVAGTIWWQAQDKPVDSGTSQLAQDGSTQGTNPNTNPEIAEPANPTVANAPTDTRLATNDTATSKPAEKSLTENISQDLGPQSQDSKPDMATVANSDASPNVNTPPANDATTPTPSANDLKMLENMANAAGSVESLNVLMVVDVTLTKEAWENQSFSQILNEYGIKYEKPIVADESLNQVLEKSKLVSKAGTDATPSDPVANNHTGEVQLVFIQARAARIDNAIKDIFERIDEYPSLYFDLSMDGPCQDVVNRLEAVSPFDGDGEDVFGIATAVQNGIAPNAEEANEFAGAKPRGEAVPLANRQNKRKATVEEPVSMNPISTVLFILRKPEGASGRP